MAGGINTYAYVGGNPLRYTDPYGLCPFCPAVFPAVAEGLSAAAIAIATRIGISTAATAAGIKALNEINDDEASDAGSDEGGQCESDSSKHDKDRRALNDLIKDLTLGGRRPLSSDDGDAAIDLANDLGIPGVRDDRGADHWQGGPHIHIPGSGIGHIPARR